MSSSPPPKTPAAQGNPQAHASLITPAQTPTRLASALTPSRSLPGREESQLLRRSFDGVASPSDSARAAVPALPPLGSAHRDFFNTGALTGRVDSRSYATAAASPDAQPPAYPYHLELAPLDQFVRRCARIGSGGFAEVHSGRALQPLPLPIPQPVNLRVSDAAPLVQPGDLVAVKYIMVRPHDPKDVENMVALLRSEASLLFHARASRFVLPLLGVCQRRLALVVPLADSSLHDVVHAHRRAGRRLSLGAALRVAGDILAGLEDLHVLGLAHLDIKPANILLQRGPSAARRRRSLAGDAEQLAGLLEEPDVRVMLTDFGMARWVSPEAATAAEPAWRATDGITLIYAPPEAIAHFHRSSLDPPARPSSPLTARRALAAQDVYAFGMLLYEMLAGAKPFSSESRSDLPRRIVHENLRPDLQPLRARGDLVMYASGHSECLLALAPGLPPPELDVVGVLRRCWEAQPHLRPSAATLLGEWGRRAAVATLPPARGHWPTRPGPLYLRSGRLARSA